jgi:glycosyltransferase involved in cell wall biosynthesis
MSVPTVSVIMPAYNGAAWIGETIESVLAQSFPDFELVIVDDCSTDSTWDVIQRQADPRIRCFRAERNGGPVQARNLAFSHARGRYIVGLDQDDLCLPDRFARQVAYLEAHPDTVLVATECRLMRGGRLQPWSGEEPTTPRAIDFMMMVGNPLPWSSVMFRADAARRLTPFERQDMLYAEDFDLYHRLRAFGTIARIDAPLLIYRCHEGGASKRFEDIMCASAARVLAEAYAPIFGDRAADHAHLVVQHLMHGLPVPDLAILAEMLAIIASLHRHFLEQGAPDPATEQIVAREYARLWWKLAKPALRHGTVGLRDVLALRPPHVRLSLRDPDWLLSPLVGMVRRCMPRSARTAEMA